MPHLTWSRRAVRDLDRIDAFLRSKSSRAAGDGFNAILRSSQVLTTFPAAGRPAEALGKGYREWIVKVGSGAYILLYEVRAEEVLILALRHSREADYPDLSGP